MLVIQKLYIEQLGPLQSLRLAQVRPSRQRLVKPGFVSVPSHSNCMPNNLKKYEFYQNPLLVKLIQSGKLSITDQNMFLFVVKSSI